MSTKTNKKRKISKAPTLEDKPHYEYSVNEYLVRTGELSLEDIADSATQTIHPKTK